MQPVSIFCVLLASVVALCIEARHAAVPTPFMNGLSSAGDDAASVDEIADVGATHVRRYIMWGSFVPSIETLETNLTLEALKTDPQSQIYAWGATLNWGYGDQQVDLLIARNITPIVELSEGTHYGLPRYNGTYADPSVIGVPLYLAYQYRFCRAAVHRYKARGVHMYQIENELNEAFLSGFMGQRLIAGIWGNWTFLTELLQTLRDAVKDEDPTAKVTMNFHTDIPEVIHATLHLPGFYLDAVRSWSSLLDVISIDAYPNMFVATPLGSGNVSQRVAATLAAVNHTQEVFVMESGYPVNADNNTNAPLVFNFSLASQAQYAADCVREVQAAGGSGFFYFKFTPTPGMQPPPGGYTAEDNSMFAAIRNFMWSNDEAVLIEWLLEPGSLTEVLTRASYFMGEPDRAGWGVFDENGSERPIFDALKLAFANSH